MPKERVSFPSRGLKCVKALGCGSFGETFLVKDAQGSRFVVKRARDGRNLDDNPEIEAESNMTQLASEHVVKLLDTWREPNDNRVCLLMEYCNGEDLESFLSASYPLPERTVIALCVQLLIGLDHIHLRHLLHRDIKPGNILLHVNDRSDDAVVPTVKLADFGVSKRLAHTDSLAATRLGTPMYLSPEILAGHRYTRKTDVWSMGVVFYKMMTNRMPFKGQTIVDLTQSVLHDEPRHPSFRENGTMAYSLGLGGVVLHMLSKSRSSRPNPRDLLASPSFDSMFTAWPWKSNVFRGAVGVFACKKRAVVNIRAEPNVEAAKVGSARYGDQLFVKREVLSRRAADDAGEQVMWFQVLSPCQGYCILGYGADSFFQLFQNPDSCTAGRSTSSSMLENDEGSSRRSSLSCSVDPTTISSLFQGI